MSETKEYPILFSAPMVRAVLSGAKTPRKKIYPRLGEDPNSDRLLWRRLTNGADVDVATGCWVWGRTHNGLGYGTLTVNHKRTYAHRLSYRIAKGEIGDALQVLHACDNPRCINPDHLELGTSSKNMRDCYLRGRSRIPSPCLSGEKNGAAKLRASDVELIRKKLASGTQTQRLIASQFGISQATVSLIKLEKLWTK